MKYLITNEYWKPNKDYNLDKLLYLLIDRPDYISENNIAHWISLEHYNNSEYILPIEKYKHRNYDLPAEINLLDVYPVSWYIKLCLHRVNGKPASIFPSGEKIYYQYGSEIKREYKGEVHYRYNRIKIRYKNEY